MQNYRAKSKQIVWNCNALCFQMMLLSEWTWKAIGQSFKDDIFPRYLNKFKLLSSGSNKKLFFRFFTLNLNFSDDEEEWEKNLAAEDFEVVGDNQNADSDIDDLK